MAKLPSRLVHNPCIKRGKIMGLRNRQWLLARRPAGSLSEQDFEYRETVVAEPDPDAGDVLLQNLWLGFDATQREWVKDQEGYLPPVGVGEVMRASAVAVVVRSANPALPKGTLVQGLFGWQDYVIVRPDDAIPPSPLPAGVSPEMCLAALGGTSLTAYFGLVDVGGLAAGKTVVVSAAGGATGSMAVQIARLRGARVIGIAGGADKCAWVKSLGAEDCIDYHQENLPERLAALCPEGIDIAFDNVGGAQLEAMIGQLAHRGRAVLCGQIAGYDAPEAPPGPRNLMTLIYRCARVEGFLMLDYLHRTHEAFAELGPWLGSGELRWHADVQEGFEHIPRTLLRLFRGENRGKQLLRLDPPKGGPA
jgi:NADPH-dependent curcumin reductase CurA